MLQQECKTVDCSALIIRAEFIELAGTTQERLQELMEMGWITPARIVDSGCLFQRSDIYRIRKLERLCTDFDLHTLGGSIVVDLLDRIDALELRLQELTNSRETLL